jgi:hypothetical protein
VRARSQQTSTCSRRPTPTIAHTTTTANALACAPNAARRLLADEGLEGIRKLRQGPSATTLTRGRQPITGAEERVGHGGAGRFVR